MSNLNPKKGILKTLIFWKNMTFWYDHAWYMLGCRVRHTCLLALPSNLGLLIKSEFVFVDYVLVVEF